MWSAAPWLLLSYLLGAIPTSYIVGKVFRGVDLRQIGSGNLGATNLYRTLGWRFAVPVGLFDVAKGAVPVLVFGPRLPAFPLFPVLCGMAAVFGHVFSVFVNFRGGKGVATAAGMILAIAPMALLVAALVWLLVLRLSGYVSLASIVAAAVFPLADWLLHAGRRSAANLGIDVALAAFIIWKHRSNIQRLLNGTEHRFRRHGAAAGSA
jgi:glycerol-3-phosphate acyltransferase PlsY